MIRQEVESVVDKLDSMKLIRKSRITGDWYTVYCPFHKDGQEQKPSCGVLLVDQMRNGTLYKAGFWHCFTCGHASDMRKSVKELLQIKKIDAPSAQWISDNLPEIDEDYNNTAGESLVPSAIMGGVLDKYTTDSLRLQLRSKQNYISEQELASYRFFHPYMFQRRLTQDVILRYDVGFDAHHIPPGRSKELPCITFPVRDREGHTLFFCRRSIEGKYFNYPEGVTKPVYGLYELPSNCTSIIICESVFNCLTAVTYGYNAVALLGTGNSFQISQLKKLGVHEFVICLDPDDAGQKGTAKLKKALSECAFIWTIQMPPGKDLNDCSKEEFDLLYAQKF